MIGVSAAMTAAAFRPRSARISSASLAEPLDGRWTRCLISSLPFR